MTIRSGQTIPSTPLRMWLARVIRLNVPALRAGPCFACPGGIVKRSLAMVVCDCVRAIARAHGVDDATLTGEAKRVCGPSASRLKAPGVEVRRVHRRNMNPNKHVRRLNSQCA
jgi:hypothetical protein